MPWNLHRHLNTRQQLTFCLVSAALMCVGARSATGEDEPPGSPDKVTHLVAIIPFGRKAYVHVAGDKGFFTARGINVDVRVGKDTTSDLGLLASGRALFSRTTCQTCGSCRVKEVPG